MVDRRFCLALGERWAAIIERHQGKKKRGAGGRAVSIQGVIRRALALYDLAKAAERITIDGKRLDLAKLEDDAQP